MRVDILTLFPGMFAGPFSESMLKRAQEKGLASIHLHDIRDYTTDKHHVVDDYPYGGGAGMVMKPEPVYAALQSVFAEDGGHPTPAVLLMTPQGERFTQAIARELVEQPWLVIICGHYEGVDERIRQHMVTRELSIGDYVLTGGELPAMVITETVIRLIPGVMGSDQSAEEESFAAGLLEYPHYTRPPEFMGWRVPPVLLSGHHAEVEKWRRRQSLLRTAVRRPDLLDGMEIVAADRQWLSEALAEHGATAAQG
ncbi:MAG: tRNA (guanosine(37)-N1)-methyltransferase TrmD [Dehalococcoidia bacterium]|nr:tRNA (guanosine(37)-N1)-methyltransferase TrmD [Dehalococcoidia bacterium]